MIEKYGGYFQGKLVLDRDLDSIDLQQEESKLDLGELV